MSSPTILVIGASGVQGGAVARALLRNNWKVHALVRDTTPPAAQALSSQGAQLFQGDWDNIPALQAAAKNCTGLFLNSYPSFEDVNAETRQSHNILTAAKNAGVKHVVYSSAIAVDKHKTLINPEPNTFLAQYFNSKLAIETEVQNGGWESWTILRGAIFMPNFLLPGSSFMYPELATEGKFVTAYEPDSKLLLLDPEDIGSFAFAAFSDPGKFGGKGLTLAVEGFSVQEMATLMEKVSGKKVEVRFRTDEEVEALKGTNPIVASQVALRKVHTWLDLEEVRAWGVPMGTFEQFLEKEKDRLLSSIGPQA